MRPYTHFTLTERGMLVQCRNEGKTQTEIAKAIGKSRSSVSRELKRNSNKDGSYNAWRGCTLYTIRRKKSRRRLVLADDSPLKTFVQQCLAKGWSPEIIVARWKRLHNGAKLSPTTIYAAIRRGSMKGMSAATHLRRHGRRKHHQNHPLHTEQSIELREEIINNRGRIGDWEGDTVHGKRGTGMLFTCVDRQTRMLVAAKLTSLDAAQTRRVMVESMQGQPLRSLTLDNGSEFAQFLELKEALGIPVYFAHTHSPWERGSNENMNGLLRFFFPKGTDFRQITQERLDEVVSLINNRPRKCLDWLSPIEYLAACCT